MILHFIKDHDGRCRAFSEQDLHDAVLEDEARGFYDTSSPVGMKPMLSWCAPVTEIASVIDEFENKTFKDDVCRTILNRCSFFHEQGYIFKEDAETSMWKFFTKLSPDLAKNYEARENYIDKFIDRVVIRGQIYPTSHGGNTWRKFCQDFRKENQNSWKGFYKAEDFLKWAEEIKKDFKERYEKAEKESLFKEEDERDLGLFVKTMLRSMGEQVN